MTVVQNDLCNSNGIVDVVYTHPYTIEVQFPNFTTATYNSTQDTITLSGLFGGNYTITTQDANNCSGSISLTSNSIATTVFSPTFFTNGYNVNCYGDCNGQIFVNLTNPSELYTIDWYLDSVFGTPFHSSTTATSNSSNQANLCAGDYVFLFTAESGCQSTRNYTLREPDSLYIQGVASEVVCNSGSSGSVEIDVTGGVGETINNANGNVVDTLDYTFSWTSTNAFTSADEDIFGLASGDYTVTVTDANGCTAQESFSVVDTVTPISVSLISQDSVTCFGQDDGALEVSASGGRGTLEFSIDSVVWQSSGLFVDLTAGTHDVYARDTNGCVGVETFEVLTYAEISFDILTLDTIFCQDSLANIHVQANGGNAPYQYIINTPQLTGLFEDLPAADYTIFAEDAYGCIRDTTLTVSEVPFLSVDVISTDLSCFNSADGSIVVTPSNGTPVYDITIGTSDTLTNTSFEVLDFVAGDYNVSVVDAKGCPYDTQIQIAEPNEIILSFDDVVNSNCFGSNSGSIDITHTGGVGELTFSWSKDGLPLAINTVSASALSPGSYSVFATDETSCVSQTIDTVVTEPSLLELSIDSIANPLCFGGSDGYISVSSVGGTLPYSYSWSGDTTVISSDFLSNVSDGVYNVFVTDNNNCTDTILNIALNQPNQMAFINPTPIVDVECFGASTGQISVEVIGGLGPFNFSSLPNIGSLSTPTPSSFTVSDVPSGQYQITVTDGNACVFCRYF